MRAVQTKRWTWSAPLLILAGCGAPASNVTETTNTSVTEVGEAPPVATDAPTTGDSAPAPAAPTAPSGSTAPAPTPAPTDASLPEGPFAPDSGQAAADVVQRYHALIEAKRYSQAYRLWEPGAAGMSAGAFAASFARYAEYHAEVGAPGRVDAGAGQRYVTVPVRVYGTLASGGPFAMAGSFVLHRTADIDGATAEQRQWRIRSSDLKQRPATTPAPAGIVNARYRCIDGSRLVARFDNGAGNVTLRRGGTVIGVLPQQRAGSGIWYKRGAMELRGKGDAATFIEPGKPPIACTAIR